MHAFLFIDADCSKPLELGEKIGVVQLGDGSPRQLSERCSRTPQFDRRRLA